MKELVFPAADQGLKFPIARGQGRSRRGELEDTLSERPGSDVVLDFTDVTAMTVSYADELVGTFVDTFKSNKDAASVSVRHVNPVNKEAIQFALERRGLCVVFEDSDGALSLLGDQKSVETFAAANDLKSFRAQALAEKLSISPQNANNRLKPLVECGALKRERVMGAQRGGKEFTYSVFNAEERAAHPVA